MHLTLEIRPTCTSRSVGQGGREAKGSCLASLRFSKRGRYVPPLKVREVVSSEETRKVRNRPHGKCDSACTTGEVTRTCLKLTRKNSRQDQYVGVWGTSEQLSKWWRWPGASVWKGHSANRKESTVKLQNHETGAGEGGREPPTGWNSGQGVRTELMVRWWRGSTEERKAGGHEAVTGKGDCRVFKK